MNTDPQPAVTVPAMREHAERLAPALELLRRSSDVPPQPLYTTCGIGNEGITVPVPVDRAMPIWEELHSKMECFGCYLFLFRHDTDVWDGSKVTRGSLIAIVPTDDQLEAVRIVGTAPLTYGREALEVNTNEYLVQWLDALHDVEPFALCRIESLYLEGRFNRPVANPKQIARKITRVCSDVAYQVFHSPRDLAADIERTRRLILWWD